MAKTELKTKVEETLDGKINAAVDAATTILEDKEQSTGNLDDEDESDPDPNEKPREKKVLLIPEAKKEAKTKIPGYEDIIYKIIPKYIDKNSREVKEDEEHIGVVFNGKKIEVTSIFGSSRSNIVTINGEIDIPKFKKDYDNLSITEKVFTDEAEFNRVWEALMKKEKARVEERIKVEEKLLNLVNTNLTQNLKFE